MNESRQPSPAPRSDSSWAQDKVRELVRRAALNGAADLQRLAARLLAGPRP